MSINQILDVGIRVVDCSESLTAFVGNFIRRTLMRFPEEVDIASCSIKGDDGR